MRVDVSSTDVHQKLQDCQYCGKMAWAHRLKQSWGASRHQGRRHTLSHLTAILPKTLLVASTTSPKVPSPMLCTTLISFWGMR